MYGSSFIVKTEKTKMRKNDFSEGRTDRKRDKKNKKNVYRANATRKFYEHQESFRDM